MKMIDLMIIIFSCSLLKSFQLDAQFSVRAIKNCDFVNCSCSGTKMNVWLEKDDFDTVQNIYAQLLYDSD
jgi:hypothetical protein